MDKPKFKKVTTEETKSHLLPMDYGQVEDEVLAAKDEVNAEKAKVAEVSETAPEVKQYDREKAVKEELKSMSKPKPHGQTKQVIQQLRLKDRKNLNKTCSRCGRRMPLAKMDGGNADICDDCK